jgi:formylglycine-generating enzyme required for sulfatase activity
MRGRVRQRASTLSLVATAALFGRVSLGCSKPSDGVEQVGGEASSNSQTKQKSERNIKSNEDSEKKQKGEGNEKTAACPEGMKKISDGSFKMGSTIEDESPAHEERVAAFCLDRTEVTVAEYARCRDAEKCPETGNAQTETRALCNEGQADMAKHPINCLGRGHAVAYCAFVGKRLPKEAEWEFAARGAEHRRHPWGETFAPDALCWNGHQNDRGAHGWKATCPVGTHPKGDTPEGVADMLGNVWEWVEDAYCPYDHNKPCQGGPPYPFAKTTGVIRGYSWINNTKGTIRPQARGHLDHDRAESYVGVRCAKGL